MVRQSSTAVVCRALVMLACLVAIPLAAVFGKSLPDMIKRLLDGRWPAGSASAYGPLGEAPRFEPVAAADPAPGVSADQTTSDRQAAPLPDPPRWPGGRVDPGSSAIVPADYQTPVAPASGSTLSGWPSGAVSPSEPDHSQPAGQTRSSVGQFTYIQNRLRQLGANYYLLESWGNQQQLYRFYCKMAVGGNPNYTRYFEATASDPLQAMAQVLQQVETWRAGRR